MYVCIGIYERRREEVGPLSSAGGSRSCQKWGCDGHGGGEFGAAAGRRASADPPYRLVSLKD
ncbi:hypothetical protein HanIR_Chr01g0042111 [Helianthus annuus]|nr:hypothetical protein HanIR_Chr01g0042111 [Helianthus annuus]